MPNTGRNISSSTVPCPPAGLSAEVDCDTNSATLSWDASPNAVSYTATAVSTEGHEVSCDGVATTGCVLESLHCGQEYQFTVSASDGTCQTPQSQPVSQFTGEKTQGSLLHAVAVYFLCSFTASSFSNCIHKQFVTGGSVVLPHLPQFEGVIRTR